MPAIGLCALPYDHWLAVLRWLQLGDLARLRACATGLHRLFVPAAAAAAWAAVRPTPGALDKLCVTAPVAGLVALEAAYGKALIAASSESGLWYACSNGDIETARWHAERSPPRLDYDLWAMACTARGLELVRWLTGAMGLAPGGPSDLFLMSAVAAAGDPAILRWAIGHFGWSGSDVRTNLAKFLAAFCGSGDFDGARWFAALVALGPADAAEAHRALTGAVRHGHLDAARWLAELCEIPGDVAATLAAEGFTVACATGGLDLARRIADAYTLAPAAYHEALRRAIWESQLEVAEWVINHFGIDGKSFQRNCRMILPPLYRHGRLDELCWLAARYGPATIRACYSEYALTEAVESGSLPVVRWVTALYQTSRDTVHASGVLRKAVLGGAVDVAAWLVHQYFLTAQDIPETYEMCAALASQGDAKMVGWLAETFPSIIREQGAMLMYSAVTNNRQEVVEVLVAKRLEPKDSWRLLSVAADNGSVGVAALLAERCQFPSDWHRANRSRRLLRRAATQGFGEFVKWVVDAFQPPRRAGLRAFLAACSYGHREVAQWLAAAYAVAPKDRRVLGRALCVARRRRHRGVVRWLTAQFRLTLLESDSDENRDGGRDGENRDGESRGAGSGRDSRDGSNYSTGSDGGDGGSGDDWSGDASAAES